jgi:hypothetical protein
MVAVFLYRMVRGSSNTRGREIGHDVDDELPPPPSVEQLMAMYEANRDTNQRLFDRIVDNATTFQGLWERAMEAEKGKARDEESRKRPREDGQSSGSVKKGKTGYRPAKLTCHSCGQPGHYSSECPLQNPNATAVGTDYRPAGLICYKCGEPGHYAFECPLKNMPPSNRPGAPTCYACGLSGHYSFQCVQKSAQPSNLNASAVDTGYRPPAPTCYACGMPGHYSFECNQKNAGLGAPPPARSGRRRGRRRGRRNHVLVEEAQEDPCVILGTTFVNSFQLLLCLIAVHLIHSCPKKLAHQNGLVFEELFNPLIVKFPGFSWYAIMICQDRVLDIKYLQFPLL